MRMPKVDGVFVGLTAVAVLLIVAMLGVIVGDILIHGWERLSWEFLTASPRAGMTQGGIFPAIFGTGLLVLVMTVCVVAVGVWVAICFSEYAKRDAWLYRRTPLAVNKLGGVPS